MMQFHIVYNYIMVYSFLYIICIINNYVTYNYTYNILLLCKLETNHITSVNVSQINQLQRIWHNAAKLVYRFERHDAAHASRESGQVNTF